jgi:tetratricopeptide (TPR) repeat protein
MWTAVWRILYGPTFRAMQLPLALRVAVIFVAASGCETATAAEDLAVCFNAEGDAAVSACTAAITSGKRQATDLAIAHIIRGNAYVNKGDYNAAARDYDEAIRLNPKNAAAFYNRANVFFAWADTMRRSRTTIKPSS